eukprot:3286219-Alexandrium_andersonii.AAC.1
MIRLCAIRAWLSATPRPPPTSRAALAHSAACPGPVYGQRPGAGDAGRALQWSRLAALGQAARRGRGWQRSP